MQQLSHASRYSEIKVNGDFARGENKAAPAADLWGNLGV